VTSRTVGWTVCLVFATCVDGGLSTPEVDGPRVAIAVSALGAVVADAVWDVWVTNGDPGGDVVFEARIAASRFGAGGSATYVGPCDATPLAPEDTSRTNTVNVRLVGVYAASVAEPGGFGAPVPGGALAAVDPGDLRKPVACSANEDAAVAFDVTVMRPAGQGFLDIAVGFGDIFCSAKLDCDAGRLLFDGSGNRADTMVLGFACTAGAGADVDTHLHLDDVVISCAGDVVATVSPAAGVGNLCTGWDADGQATTCAAGVDPAGILFQAAVYQGEELLEGLNKRYWNVALGARDGLTALGSACVLTTRGTATDGPDGDVAAGDVYPFITWEVPLEGCTTQHALTFDEAAPVRVAYTQTTAASDLTFTHTFPSLDVAAARVLVTAPPGATRSLVFCRYGDDCAGLQGSPGDFGYQLAFVAAEGSAYRIAGYAMTPSSMDWSDGVALDGLTLSTPSAGADLSGDILTAASSGLKVVDVQGVPLDALVYFEVNLTDGGNDVAGGGRTDALAAYTSVGGHTFYAPTPAPIELLVVAGGGGGGVCYGGGGGAGGLIEASILVSDPIVSVFVGSGGDRIVNTGASGGFGSSSALGDVAAVGGGFGAGACGNVGGAGGSGGGGSHTGSDTRAGGAGTPGQGHAGATSPHQRGGGGGGAGASGQGQQGGDGFLVEISGVGVPYAGGGSGGGPTLAGGFGGGGTGGTALAPGVADAVPNTGGGGGGSIISGSTGASGWGGSGIVIARFSTCADGELSGDESDVDCGGSCAPCGGGDTCFVDSDCSSGACLGGTCQ